MKHVIQRTPHDCVLAAMAMAVGKDYDEAWTPEDTAAVVASKGVADWEPWFTKQGLKEGRDWLVVYCSHIEQNHLKALLFARPALLSVCSLNNSGGWHAVYWDGFKLWDPSNRKQYEHLSSLCIERALLLRGDRSATTN